jgi:outer membrane assembly lipoprotein YfiO
MSRWIVRLAFCLSFIWLLQWNTPAPLIYRAGEGWSYESIGGGKWRRTKAKDQLEVAQASFDKKQYNTALKAARRTVRTWPLSDYAPQAQYLVGRCYEEKHQDEKAFKQYQLTLEKYPKVANYEEILNREYIIANRYLAGQWFKLWGYIPFFPSMDKTAKMYENVIKNGPFSQVGPPSQMNVGAAREKQSDYPAAVKAYERAADRYHDDEKIAANAMYKAGLAYQKQAKTADYDQSIAGQAISTFTDFITLYPKDARSAEAQKIIASLKTEQARGSYNIARFYEKKKRWDAALIYYNEVRLRDPHSPFVPEATQRIEAIRKKGKQTAQLQ